MIKDIKGSKIVGEKKHVLDLIPFCTFFLVNNLGFDTMFLDLIPFLQFILGNKHQIFLNVMHLSLFFGTKPQSYHVSLTIFIGKMLGTFYPRPTKSYKGHDPSSDLRVVETLWRGLYGGHGPLTDGGRS